jgi:hypothetical protein
MEKKQRSHGKFIYFSPKEIKFVGESIEKGKSTKYLTELFGVGTEKIFRVLEQYLQTLSKKRSRLGYKDESYYTEEQMLKGLPQYKWEDLDYYEKQFYLKYGKKFRKRYRRNDKTLE